MSNKTSSPASSSSSSSSPSISTSTATTTPSSASPSFQNLSISRAFPTDLNIYILTLHKPPENRITTAFAQSIISALRHIESLIRASSPSHPPPGAVILRSSSLKYFCTGLDLHEGAQNPYANSDGFYPLLATLLDYPFPTVAAVTGHCFGGAVPLALACDYRVMNRRRGFVCMPPVDLGLHFPGIGALSGAKLDPKVARAMLLEGRRWTGEEALRDGIVDGVEEPEELEAKAVEMAGRVAERAKGGVYGVLRGELWKGIAEGLRGISYVHSRRVGVEARSKI